MPLPVTVQCRKIGSSLDRLIPLWVVTTMRGVSLTSSAEGRYHLNTFPLGLFIFHHFHSTFSARTTRILPRGELTVALGSETFPAFTTKMQRGTSLLEWFIVGRIGQYDNHANFSGVASGVGNSVLLVHLIVSECCIRLRWSWTR